MESKVYRYHDKEGWKQRIILSAYGDKNKAAQDARKCIEYYIDCSGITPEGEAKRHERVEMLIEITHELDKELTRN